MTWIASCPPRRVLGVIACLLLGGCGKDETTKPPPVVVGPEDAGPDASSEDGGGSGGGGSGAAARGGSGGKAGTTGGRGGSGADDDAGTDPNTLDPTEACKLAEENSRLELPVKFGTEAGFAIAIGVTGFGVAYDAGECGTIGTLPVASSGMFAEPMKLLGDCARIQDVSLLRVSDGWRLGWIDNATGSSELQSALLSDELGLHADSTRDRITNDMLREHAPVGANIAGTPYLAWISEDLTNNQRQISRKRLDGDGNVEILLPFDADRRPISLALAQVGRENAALAFVTEEGERGVWLQALDDSAKRVGDPVLLTEFVTAGNSVDLATREEDGGGVVYSIDVEGANHEVRFRRLDKDGKLLGDEVKVVGSPLQGRDASVARISGGYVVAYRQIPISTDDKSEVRIAFITKEGNVMRDGVGRLLTYAIADADPNGGRVTVRVSVDGQLLVAFLNGAGDDNKLVVVRKRLDCTL